MRSYSQRPPKENVFQNNRKRAYYKLDEALGSKGYQYKMFYVRMLGGRL
ncbi:hypothetical protein OKW24_002967 [Peribacillus simplex]|nr:hypothetical protein [Peribacillus simplex]